jgi:heterotetrameric sarcosine oxidase delta subunit
VRTTDTARIGGARGVTFLINCPHCGPREATEFSFGGEMTRRAGPDATDRELSIAPYVRRDIHGWQTEWWRHDAGCRSWFLVERHTATDEVRRVVRPEARGPEDVST